MKSDIGKIPEAASADALATLLDVTPRRVRQIASESHIKAAGRGLWPVAPIVRAAVAAAGREREGSAERDARAALMRARAREIELRTAREEGELVPTEEAVAYTQSVVGALISRMNGLPARITRDARERRKIEAILDEIRADVAKASAEHGPAYRSLPDEPEASQ